MFKQKLKEQSIIKDVKQYHEI